MHPCPHARTQTRPPAGVICDNFNRLKEEMGEGAMLTPAQREWVATQHTLLDVRPERRGARPTSWWGLGAHKIVNVSALLLRARALPHAPPSIAVERIFALIDRSCA
jgi:hypothetical protein